MASKTPLPLNKEDEVGRKWDRCLTDLILKLGKYFEEKNEWIEQYYFHSDRVILTYEFM